MLGRSRRFIALIVLCLHLGACVTWVPVTASPESVIRDAPRRVRVTSRTGVPMTLERPAIRAGALVATASPGAVLLEDIRTMEVEKVSLLRTALLVLPGVFIMALVVDQVRQY